MPHPCQYGCGCISDTHEEKSRHERTCLQRKVSCCQSSASCSKTIREWLAPSDLKLAACCKHSSNGLFGAVKEDNAELVHFFLSQLKPNLADALTHETKFGDTVVTYAASLGRSEIVQVLAKAMQSIVQNENDALALYDLVDHETSRGKTALIEAVKNNRVDCVAILLSRGANSNLPSRIHHKSALDWAIALGHEPIARMIDNHTQLEEHVRSLFKAVSKFDVPTVKELTEGGAPFQQGQDAKIQEELESRRCSLDEAKHNLDEVSLAHQLATKSKEATFSENQQREKHIVSLERKRDDIESHRRNEVRAVTARVQEALDATDITHVANPPMDYELISKALCALLRIKVRETHPNAEEGPVMPYWEEIKCLLRDDKRRLMHRIGHYHFEVGIVETAARVAVEGLPGTTCSEYLSTMLESSNQALNEDERVESTSPLVTALARWLWTLFRHVSVHKLERELLMEVSDERDVLERRRIDCDVLTSRSAILKRELDDVKASIEANTKLISQLERKLEISRVMKFVVGGHSILSWAAGGGNEEIVKILLKRGAHTAIGEYCLGWCASLIQVAFRHHLQKRKLQGIPHDRRPIQAASERRKQDLAVSLRIRSLSNLIRERLGSIHLPLAEALFNGHSKVTHMLDRADIPLCQAINLFPLFHQPDGMIPRPTAYAHPRPPTRSNGCELLSCLVEAGQQYSYEPDPRDCIHVDSLKRGIDLVQDFLEQRRAALEAKITRRRETLSHRNRRAMISELTAAIRCGDFVAMVEASHKGGISLDYEDPQTGMTPLIRAAMEDVHSPLHEWCKNSVGENVTAVAYLLDRISPHRPTVDYENKDGHTALAMACMHGRLEVVKDLIDRGADVDRVSTMLKCTAYDLAVNAKQVDVVEFLDRLRDSKPK